MNTHLMAGTASRYDGDFLVGIVRGRAAVDDLVEGVEGD
jgi:hypothetical protein